jgi:hypothetical protein
MRIASAALVLIGVLMVVAGWRGKATEFLQAIK